MSKYLQQLLSNQLELPVQYNCLISSLALHSAQVTEGSLFFACQGYRCDGRDFVEQAITNGAHAIMLEAADRTTSITIKTGQSRNKKIPIITLPDLRQHIGLIASKFYDNPSSQMQVIGITGTNGKSSSSHFLAHAFEQLGRRCGIIGTLGTGFPNALTETKRTTPDPISLMKNLANLRDQGAEFIVMEVSSHALDQYRTNGVKFDSALLTNITQDHLDYHDTMQQYAYAKKKLFTQPGLRCGILNLNDPIACQWAEELQQTLPLWSYSIETAGYTLDKRQTMAKQLYFSHRGFKTELETPWGNGHLSSRLLGKFNVSNILAAFSILGVYGLCTDDEALQKVLDVLAQSPPLIGRMQPFGGYRMPLVVVDYAHTPDALEQVLVALRMHCKRKLWCVVGCGGDRDRGKRVIMGQIAERYSDELIITDDNPRTEDPYRIVQDITSQLVCPWAVEVEHDRKTAIHRTIQSAGIGDMVLIAGKGHERYQLVGDQQLPFNDIEQVQLALNKEEEHAL